MFRAPGSRLLPAFDVIDASRLAAVSFLGMLALGKLGRRLGRRRFERDPEGARAGIGVVDGAVFGLLGLLVAFTFSGAGSRCDARRHLVVEEANAIGTAWLRLDLLLASAQPALRDLYRRYLDTRLDVYEVVPDLAAAREALACGTGLQNEIWSQAVAASPRGSGPSSCSCRRRTKCWAAGGKWLTRPRAELLGHPAELRVRLLRARGTRGDSRFGSPPRLLRSRNQSTPRLDVRGA